MIDYMLMFAVIAGIALLLFLILRIKLNAFLALLMASITVGLLAGMSFTDITDTITEGMGNTLGFVAVVVGLGSIFGAILDHSGGARNLALFMLGRFGEKKASAAMLVSGFLIAIPVFFDVAFIILVPILSALSKRTGKHIMVFALPLLTGIGITHSFIPPTPGPVAVADILKADLGWVIFLGLIVAIPTAMLCGLVISPMVTRRYKDQKISTEQLNELEAAIDGNIVRNTLLLIGLPIVLILTGTLVKTLVDLGNISQNLLIDSVIFLGHPFTALILATLSAMYFMGTRYGVTREKLFELSNNSLAPAGAIILITGGGGVFKQTLIETGAGQMVAEALAGTNMYIIVLAYIISALMRVIQGSATVAMITAAGIVAPLIIFSPVSNAENALLVLAIAAGSVFMSHVNDSGFWLVNRYLDISVPETLRTWSVLSSLISLIGFLIIMIIFLFIGG